MQKKTPVLVREPGQPVNGLGCGLQSLSRFLGWLLFPDHFADGSRFNFPRSRGNGDRIDTDVHVLQVGTAPQFAFNQNVIALGERADVFGQLVPDDDAMPLGVRLPLVRIFDRP